MINQVRELVKLFSSLRPASWFLVGRRRRWGGGGCCWESGVSWCWAGLKWSWPLGVDLFACLLFLLKCRSEGLHFICGQREGVLRKLKGPHNTALQLHYTLHSNILLHLYKSQGTTSTNTMIQKYYMTCIELPLSSVNISIFWSKICSSCVA